VLHPNTHQRIEGPIFEFREWLIKFKADAFDELQNYFQMCQRRTSEKPWEISNYHDSITVIANMLQNSSVVPSNVLTDLPATLSQLTLDLESVLFQLQEKDLSKRAQAETGMNGKTIASKTAKSLLSTIEKVKTKDSKIKQQVSDLTSKLKPFASAQ